MFLKSVCAFCSRNELENLIDCFLNEGEKGYKEGHEHDEGKKGHHDKVFDKNCLNLILETKTLFHCRKIIKNRITKKMGTRKNTMMKVAFDMQLK